MEGHSEAAARGAGDHGAGPAIGVPTEKYSGESDSGAVGATQQLKRRASGEPETAASDFSELSKAKITEAFQAATREVAALKKRGVFLGRETSFPCLSPKTARFLTESGGRPD